MKKTFQKILVLALFFTLCLAWVSMAVGTESMDAGQEQLIDEPHVYELLPGTEEWKSASITKRRDACYVSREEAEAMTTEALLETVLTYPFLVDLFAFNFPEDGIRIVSGRFPALDVLLHREGADTVIAQREAVALASMDEDKDPLEDNFCALLGCFARRYAEQDQDDTRDVDDYLYSGIIEYWER